MSHSRVHEDQAPYHSAFDFPLTLRVNDSFEEFVRLNPDLVVEQNSNGEIVIMSPTGGESSDLHSEINFQLRGWAKNFGGATFDIVEQLSLNCSELPTRLLPRLKKLEHNDSNAITSSPSGGKCPQV